MKINIDKQMRIKRVLTHLKEEHLTKDRYHNLLDQLNNVGGDTTGQSSNFEERNTTDARRYLRKTDKLIDTWLKFEEGDLDES